MNTAILKHLLTAIGLLAAGFPLLPEIGFFKLKAKRITIASCILTMLSILGIWIIDATSKTPIRDISGLVLIGIKWDDNGQKSSSMGFEPSSRIEIYKGNKCLVSVGSTKTETIGAGKGGMIFRNDYSISTRGSYIKAHLEDIRKIDSLIIYDTDFPNEIDAVDGYVEIKIDGERYKILITPSHHSYKRIVLQNLDLGIHKI